MTGVVIDVDTRHEKAEKNLQDLNRNILQLLKNAKNTKDTLSSTDNSKGIVNLNQSLISGIKNFGSFRNAGVAANTAVARSADNAASALTSVRNIVVGITSALLAVKGVSAFNKVADDLTNVQNRLKLVSDTMEDVIRSQTKLYQLSAATRSSFAETASTFVDFSKSLETLGVSQNRILSVVKTIQQAGQLSGSSAESLKAGMIQLNQGIASGTLRGEELNSVMEQMKYLGIGLQQVLGKNAGELRKFAEEGSLTTEVLLDSLEKMRTRTESDFGRTSVTVESALNRMRESVKYLVGDFNSFYGFSGRFSKRLMGVANDIDGVNENLKSGIYILKQSITNYFNQLDLFSAAKLTLRAAVRLEISPLDVYSKYQQYKAVKERIDQLQAFMGRDKESIKVKAKVEGDWKSKIPGFKGSSEIDKEVKQVKSFRETLADIGNLGYEAARAIGITVQNLFKLLPIIAAPAISFTKSISAEVRVFYADINAAIYDALMPFARQLEHVRDLMNFKLGTDEELERRWVKLFQSKSLTEFTEHLRDLNDVRKSFKTNDDTFFLSEVSKQAYAAIRPVEKMLQSLNLIDNSLFEIRYTNLDRVIQYFNNIRLVLARIYKDVFATTVEPIAVRIFETVKLYAAAIGDALSDIFNANTGQKIGRAFVAGFTAAFGILKKLASSIVKGGNLFDDLFGDTTFDKVVGKLKNVLMAVYDFVSGFFKGVFGGIADVINPGLFTSAFRKIRNSLVYEFGSFNGIIASYSAKILDKISAYKLSYHLDFDKSAFDKGLYYIINMFQRIVEYVEQPLSYVEKRIAKFGTAVKDIFYDIWDAVVGHSYWPDLIDGVVNYVKNVFDAMPGLQAFASAVKGVFLDLFDKVSSAGGQFGAAVQTFFDKVKDVKWGDIAQAMTAQLGSSLVAALGLIFGDPRIKIAAASYFISTLNIALNGAFSAFLPIIAQQAGAIAGALAEHVAEGFLRGFNALVLALPSFWASLFESISPMMAEIGKFAGYLPIIGSFFSNHLIVALTTAAAGFALFSSSARKSLAEITFGKDKKKGGRQDGIIDYVNAFLGSGKKSKVGESLISTIFPDKKLALAAAAAFSSSLLESISLVEASTLGVPLLLFAMLGKDGGARALKDITSFGERVAINLYGTFLTTLAARAGSDSTLYKIFDAPRSFLTNMFNAPQSDLSKAAGNLMDSTKQLFKNYKDNSKQYASGKMSLMEALLTGSSTSKSSAGTIVQQTKLDYKKAFTDVFDEVGKIKVGNRSVSDYFVIMSDTFAKGYSWIKAKYKSNNIGDLLKTQATEIFGAISKASKQTFSLMADGLSAIASILGAKRVIITAILAAFFASTASAASNAGVVMDSFGTSLSTILTPILAVGVALAALGAGFRLFKTYTSARDSYLDTFSGVDFTKVQKAQFDKETAGFRDNFLKASAERKTIFAAELAKETAAMKIAQELEIKKRAGKDKQLEAILRSTAIAERSKFVNISRTGFESGENKRFSAESAAFQASLLASQKKDRSDRVKDIPGAGQAGRAAVLAKISSAFSIATNSVMGFVGAIGVLITSPAMAVSWWTRQTGAVGAWTASMLSSVKAMFITEKTAASLTLATTAMSASFAAFKAANYAESFKLLATAMVGAFNATIGLSVGSFFASIKGGAGLVTGLGGAFRSLGGVMLSLGRSIGLLLAPLLALLKIPALIAGAVALVGVAGLWLFGPANSFLDNVEWAYDKVKALFGLQPTTRSGRQIAIGENLGPTQIGDQRADFTNDLARIDYSKLSDVQVKVLQDVGKTTKEAFENIAEDFARNGFLTEENKKKFSDVENETRQILIRQPSKEAGSFKDALPDLASQINKVDNSAWALIKRMLGWEAILTSNAAEAGNLQKAWFAVTGVIGSVAGAISDFFTYIPRKIGNGLSSVGGAISSFASSAADKIVEVTKYVYETNKEQIVRIIDSFKITPSQAQIVETQNLLVASEKYAKFEDSAPSNVQKVVRDTRDQYSSALSQRDALQKRGFNTIYDKDFKDFSKKLTEANKALEETRERLFVYLKTYGDFAEEEYKVAEFNKEMQLLASSAKTLLGLDLGKYFEEFTGTNAELDRMKNLVKQVQDLERLKLTASGGKGPFRAWSQEQRAALVIQEQNLKRRAKEDSDNANAGSRFETGLDASVKSAGIDVVVDDLRNLAFTSKDAYNTFRESAERIRKLNQDIADAVNDGAAPDVVRELYSQVSSVKMDAIQAAFTPHDFNILNKRLQAVGGQQISVDQFIGIDQKSSARIRGLVDEVRVAQEALINSARDNLSPELIAKQLDKIRVKIAEANAEIKANLSSQVTDINSGKSDAVNKALSTSLLTGTALPTVASTSLKGLESYNKLNSEKIALEAKSTQFAVANAKGETVAREEVLKTQQRLLLVNDAIQRLEERHLFTVDNLLSTMSGSGFEFSMNSLIGISPATLRSIALAGEEVEAINRDLQIASAKGVAGKQLDSLLSRQAKAYDKINSLSASVALRTGESLKNAFENVGAGAYETLANLNAKSRQELLDSYIETTKLEQSLKKVMSPEQTLATLKKINDEREKQKIIAEKGSDTVETRLDRVAKIFKTDLNTMEFTGLGNNLYNTLSESARAISLIMDTIVKNSGGMSAEVLNQVYRAMDKVSKVGGFINFFRDVGKTFADTLTEGAQSAFDRIKTLLPNLKSDFKNFVQLSSPERRDVTGDAAALGLLKNAANLPNLPQEMADVLEKLSPESNLRDVLDEFNRVSLQVTGKTIEDTLASPMILQNKLTEQVRQELINVQKILKNEPVTIGASDSSPTVSGLGKTANLSSGFFKSLEGAERNIQTRVEAPLLKPGLRREDIVKRTEGLIDSATANLATGPMIEQLDRLSRGFFELNQQMATASEEQKPAIQANIELYRGAIEGISTVIKGNAEKLREAGASFSSSISSSFGSAFSDLLKGKAEEGKSAMRTFADSVLNNFTSTVIDTFSKGATDQLFGSKDGKSGLLARLGSGLAGLGAGKTEADNGADPAASDASGLFGPLLSAIQALGAMLLSPLLSMLGFDTAKAVTDTAATTAATTTATATAFAIPLAIQASTVAIVAAILSAAGAEATGDAISSIGSFMATGGQVSGPGTGTSDSIATMLSNGEYVINAKSTQKYKPLLHAINNGELKKFAQGGLVTSSMMATPSFVPIKTNRSPNGSSGQQIINLNITGDISRQTKAEIYQMLPQIADGVNMQNREKGYRG